MERKEKPINNLNLMINYFFFFKHVLIENVLKYFSLFFLIDRLNDLLTCFVFKVFVG